MQIFSYKFLFQIIFIQVLIVLVVVALNYLNDEIVLLKEELNAKSDE